MIADHSTPKLDSASSSSVASIVNRRPSRFTSSSSSNARNKRIFTAAYCSASFNGRPCAFSHAVFGPTGKNTLTAYVSFRSEVTSNTNSVAGASGSWASAPTLAHKVILINVSLRSGIGLQPTNCHAAIMERRAAACRDPPIPPIHNVKAVATAPRQKHLMYDASHDSNCLCPCVRAFEHQPLGVRRAASPISLQCCPSPCDQASSSHRSP